MKKADMASISLKKIFILSIIALFILGIAVFAGGEQVYNVKLKYANGEETMLITTKTKVSEILEENHILVLAEEYVYPNPEEEIGEEKAIIISKDKIEIQEIAEKENVQNMDEILQNYAPIVEKVIVQQEEIPFETITKDVSGGAASTQNKVITQGKNGIKEVTYKVKYQNEVEIERTKLSETVIEEPVSQVVQVQVKTTSRYGARVATTNPASTASTTLAQKVQGITPIVITANASAYCSCASCCGKTNGITASGAPASTWYTIAASSSFKLGTVVYIPYFQNQPNGGWFVVQDRGGAITGNKIDIFMGSHSQALSFGRKNLECYVYEF